jgi:hypothetical protein
VIADDEVNAQLDVSVGSPNACKRISHTLDVVNFALNLESEPCLGEGCLVGLVGNLRPRKRAEM